MTRMPSESEGEEEGRCLRLDSFGGAERDDSDPFIQASIKNASRRNETVAQYVPGVDGGPDCVCFTVETWKSWMLIKQFLKSVEQCADCFAAKC
jgi:hypothetical protein